MQHRPPRSRICGLRFLVCPQRCSARRNGAEGNPTVTESIAQRFSDVVGLHLIANLRADVKPGTPLLLGIQGPAGEGKTYQVERILENAEIYPVLLSGGELESKDAGAPASKIRAAYREAS